MNKSGKVKIVFLVLLLATMTFALISVLFKFILLPLFPKSWQTWITLYGFSFLATITFLSGSAQITGYSLRDFSFHKRTKPSIQHAIKNESINQSLHARLKFLDNITDDSDVDKLEESAGDLISFIKDMPHGSYYAKRITQLTSVRGAFSYNYVDTKGLDTFRAQVEESNKSYRQQLREARAEVYALIDELSRLQ